jgi:hypothetical protein
MHYDKPTELVWSHLKRSLANLAKRNLAQRTALVKAPLRRIQYRPSLLEGFLASTGLDLTPFCNPPLEIFRHPAGVAHRWVAGLIGRQIIRHDPAREISCGFGNELRISSYVNQIRCRIISRCSFRLTIIFFDILGREFI